MRHKQTKPPEHKKYYKNENLVFSVTSKLKPEVTEEAAVNNALADADRARIAAYKARKYLDREDDAYVTFYDFRNSCPICNDWLDCLTATHAAKHGLTLKEFIEGYTSKVFIEKEEATPRDESSAPLIDLVRAWVHNYATSAKCDKPFSSFDVDLNAHQKSILLNLNKLVNNGELFADDSLRRRMFTIRMD